MKYTTITTATVESVSGSYLIVDHLKNDLATRHVKEMGNTQTLTKTHVLFMPFTLIKH